MSITVNEISSDAVQNKTTVLPWIWFANLPAKDCNKRLLLQRFPNMQTLYSTSREQFIAAGLINQNGLGAVLSDKYKENALRILQRCEKEGIVPISRDSDEYPYLLKNIPDAPYVLYRKGKPLSGRLFSVVGSRRATGYGIRMAETLSADLCDAGFTVVSGMARGIDTAAHSGALSANGDTIAVLASSVDICYPPENKSLADRIEKNGSLLSEYPPGTPPVSFHFPVRNRIISGLSEALLVVEAGDKSGSLITVQLALDQGRDVFAVPGNALSVTSRGCNRMIREGAGLVQEIQDILECLTDVRGRWDAGSQRSRDKLGKEMHIQLNFSEQLVYNLLQKEPMYPDLLCARTGLHPGELQEVLLMLEMKRLILHAGDGQMLLR